MEGESLKIFFPFLNQHGIKHRVSCPHTSQQNGLIERKHQHIMNMGLTLLAQASMPLKFWDEAFATSVYLINRLPTPVLQSVSPWRNCLVSNQIILHYEYLGINAFLA